LLSLFSADADGWLATKGAAEAEGRCVLEDRIAQAGGPMADGVLIDDYVLPLALGGATTVANLQLLCADCNRRKERLASERWPGGDPNAVALTRPGPHETLERRAGRQDGGNGHVRDGVK
jgi:HNH endonuclease